MYMCVHKFASRQAAAWRGKRENKGINMPKQNPNWQQSAEPVGHIAHIA